MPNFPLKYEVQLEADAKINNPWTCTANNKLKTSCAIPPEFQGPGHVFTPEDFFSMAVLNCIVAAFKVLCEKQKETFQTIKGKAILNLDINHTDNNLYFTEIDINLEVTGASNKEKVKKLLDTAIATCPVGGAVKTSKTYHVKVL